jgi:hypothetical protein
MCPREIVPHAAKHILTLLSEVKFRLPSRNSNTSLKVLRIIPTEDKTKYTAYISLFVVGNIQVPVEGHIQIQ